MSGGAYNYCYCEIEDITRYAKDPEIKALLKDLAKLMYEEEWYTSGDTGYEDWVKALNGFKAKWLRGNGEERLTAIMDERIADLRNELMRMIGEPSKEVEDA